MRYTKRDHNGNARLNDGVRLMDALNRLAYFEDWQAIEDAPGIIRCRDCKHWTNNIRDSDLRENYCDEKMHGFSYQCNGDDYCSRAERKTGSKKPTEKQIAYAKYLAERMCQKLPEEFTKEAYSEFIDKWKPIVKSEDDGMNEPDAWQMQYM